uniref:Uncharacterized protein n=1 Tax=Anguilla anguilla TaxID=7936 RepID=A0A0E9U2W2_ANGAN
MKIYMLQGNFRYFTAYCKKGRLSLFLRSSCLCMCVKFHGCLCQ